MIEYINTIKQKTNINPKVVLEIGSMHGHDANALRKNFDIKDENVWVVEPNPIQYEKISKDYPNFNIIKDAIYIERGERIFYQVLGADAGTSSLYNRKDTWYERQGSGLQKIKIKTITGEDLIKRINKKIDLCKIDVEGLTYEVLLSFKEKIHNILSFHIECEHTEIWKNQTMYEEIKKYLQKKKYVQLYFKYVAEDAIQSDSIWVLNNNTLL